MWFFDLLIILVNMCDMLNLIRGRFIEFVMVFVVRFLLVFGGLISNMFFGGLMLKLCVFFEK